MYRLVTLALVLTISSAADAQPPKEPLSPAPSYSVAWQMKNGDVLLSQTRTIFRVEKRDQIVVKNGIKERVTISVRVPTVVRNHRKAKLADLSITNAAGRKLSEENIMDALVKPTIVLISSDGKPVDPFYLEIVKPDTLVIVEKITKRAAK